MPLAGGVSYSCGTQLTMRALALILGLSCGVSTSFAQTVTPRPLGAGVRVFQPAAGDPERRDTPPIENPGGAITLKDAVALALLQNPALAAFAWESRALEVRILQAGRRPNPTLDALVEDLGSSKLIGADQTRPIQPQTTLQLSQLIELGGKRTARQRLATANRELADWDFETARINVITEVSRAFTDVLAAQQVIALTDETTR